MVHFHSPLGYCFFQSFCPKTANTKFYESSPEQDLIIQLFLKPFLSLFVHSLTHLLPFRAFVLTSFPQLEVQAISFPPINSFQFEKRTEHNILHSPFGYSPFYLGREEEEKAVQSPTHRHSFLRPDLLLCIHHRCIAPNLGAS